MITLLIIFIVIIIVIIAVVVVVIAFIIIIIIIFIVTRYEYKAPVPGHWGGLGSQAEIEDDWVSKPPN